MLKYGNGNNVTVKVCGDKNIPTLSYMMINSKTTMVIKHSDQFEH